MRLDEITPQSISKVSNTELLSIHRRVHQLSGVASKYPKPSQKIIDLLKKLGKIHKILTNEMSKRKIKHKSNLGEGASMTVLGQYINLLLENSKDKLSIGENFEMPGMLQTAELLLEKKAKKWIQKAVEKPGALHKALGVPEDEKIPEEKLTVKPDDSPKMKKRKILAKTLKNITRKRTGKGEEED